VFERLAAVAGEPSDRVRVIPVQSGSFDHVLAARAAVARGEVVAILADRTAANEAARACRVRFLGGVALIPQGPFRLAAALGAPLLFIVAIRIGRGAYAIDVDWIADRVVLPRATRAQALARLCQDYADWLERHCLRDPLQWFNFYDFWPDATSSSDG
jgi:predicted LPLAT superfamily acyltransferase